MKIKIMKSKSAIEGVKKKFWLRLSNFSFFAVGFLLVDEKIKEGYFFRPSDIMTIGSHESLITLFFLIGSISYIIHKKRGVGHEGRNNS